MNNIIEDTWRIAHTWDVKPTVDFDTRRHEFPRFNSCQFPSSGQYEKKFYLTFDKNADSGYYSYYLSGPSFDIKGTLDVCLFMLGYNHVTKSNRKIERKLTCICSGNQLDKLGFPEFYKDGKSSGLFVDNHSITLGCEIVFCEKLIYSSATNSLLHYRFTQNQFKQLLENDELSDFTIVVDAQEIKVHKAILAARSPVFKTMLTINMAENKTNRLEIKDIDLKIVKAMIEFIYTNKIDDEVDLNVAEDLLIVADKYQLEDLKELCTDFMERSLNIGNVQQLMLLAKQYKSKRLMNAIKALMKSNPCAMDIVCDEMLNQS